MKLKVAVWIVHADSLLLFLEFHVMVKQANVHVWKHTVGGTAAYVHLGTTESGPGQSKYIILHSCFTVLVLSVCLSVCLSSFL